MKFYTFFLLFVYQFTDGKTAAGLSFQNFDTLDEITVFLDVYFDCEEGEYQKSRID